MSFWLQAMVIYTRGEMVWKVNVVMAFLKKFSGVPKSWNLIHSKNIYM
ncbi:hypothetical protein ACHAXH_000848 [Discostella pseudostelligera]